MKNNNDYNKIYCIFQIMFNATTSDLRYFDGTGSYMTLEHVEYYSNLIYLKLSHCNIKEAKKLNFRDLMFLDLSHNDIQHLEADFFSSLLILQELYLGHNPLVQFDVILNQSISTLTSNLYKLDMVGIDLAGDKLERLLSNRNIEIRILNISMSKTRSSIASFSNMPNIEVLDMRGVEIETFPPDVFRGLRKLEEVYVDNAKLCCPQLLPDHPKHCYTSPDEISSCENLLRANLYRVCLWFFSLAAVIGNATSFFFRLLSYTKSSKTGFSLLVINLSVSDLLMGLYLALIGGADQVYTGTYLYNDLTWRTSKVCQVRQPGVHRDLPV